MAERFRQKQLRTGQWFDFTPRNEAERALISDFVGGGYAEVDGPKAAWWPRMMEFVVVTPISVKGRLLQPGRRITKPTDSERRITKPTDSERRITKPTDIERRITKPTDTERQRSTLLSYCEALHPVVQPPPAWWTEGRPTHRVHLWPDGRM